MADAREGTLGELDRLSPREIVDEGVRLVFHSYDPRSGSRMAGEIARLRLIEDKARAVVAAPCRHPYYSSKCARCSLRTTLERGDFDDIGKVSRG